MCPDSGPGETWLPFSYGLNLVLLKRTTTWSFISSLVFGSCVTRLLWRRKASRERHGVLSAVYAFWYSSVDRVPHESERLILSSSVVGLSCFRLESELRTANSELGAGAARLDELSSLCQETAAARQETEKAYSLAMIEEKAAVKASKEEADAVATITTAAVARKENECNLATSDGPPVTAEKKRDTDREASGKRDNPNGKEVIADGSTRRKGPDGGGVLDSKRAATTSAASEPKRQRRSCSSSSSRRRSVVSPQQYGGRGGSRRRSRAINISSEATTNGGTRGPAQGATPGPISGVPEETSELIPHPVFARREKSAKSIEASVTTAEAVVDMAREVEASAEQFSACEGQLSATTAGATTANTVNTLCTST